MVELSFHRSLLLSTNNVGPPKLPYPTTLLMAC